MGMGILSREWEWRIFLCVKLAITGHAKWSPAGEEKNLVIIYQRELTVF